MGEMGPTCRRMAAPTEGILPARPAAWGTNQGATTPRAPMASRHLKALSLLGDPSNATHDGPEGAAAGDNQPTGRPRALLDAVPQSVRHPKARLVGALKRAEDGADRL